MLLIGNEELAHPELSFSTPLWTVDRWFICSVINQKAGWVLYSTLYQRCVQWKLFSAVQCLSQLKTNFSGIFQLPYWDMRRELDVDVELSIFLASKTEIWNFTRNVSVTRTPTLQSPTMLALCPTTSLDGWKRTRTLLTTPSLRWSHLSVWKKDQESCVFATGYEEHIKMSPSCPSLGRSPRWSPTFWAVHLADMFLNRPRC